MVVVDGEPRVGVQLALNHVAPDWPNGAPEQQITSTCRSRTSRPPTIVSCRWGRRCSSRRRTSTPPTTSRSMRILPGLRSAYAGFKDASSRRAHRLGDRSEGERQPRAVPSDTWTRACSPAHVPRGEHSSGESDVCSSRLNLTRRSEAQGSSLSFVPHNPEPAHRRSHRNGNDLPRICPATDRETTGTAPNRRGQESLVRRSPAVSRAGRGCA